MFSFGFETFTFNQNILKFKDNFKKISIIKPILKIQSRLDDLKVYGVVLKCVLKCPPNISCLFYSLIKHKIEYQFNAKSYLNDIYFDENKNELYSLFNDEDWSSFKNVSKT